MPRKGGGKKLRKIPVIPNSEEPEMAQRGIMYLEVHSRPRPVGLMGRILNVTQNGATLIVLHFKGTCPAFLRDITI